MMWMAIWALAWFAATGLCGAEVPGGSPFSAPARPSFQAAQPQTFEAGGEPIHILARIWEKIKDRVYAAGSVDLHYKNIRLFADRVEVDTKTKDVYAEGNVVLQSPEEVITAATMSFNMDSARGKMDRVQGRVQPNFFYEAGTLERKAEGIYSFTNSVFTSCTQPVPRWNFTCAKANFRKNDYVEMWNAVLKIKKVPVFYLPYFRYPLDTQRSTGLLMPQIGFSGPKGFIYTQSFYWAIARNMDATFNLDYYSARGVGGGAEYRYLFGGGVSGEARLYSFIFKNDPAKGPKPDNAWIFRLNHNQPLPYGFSLVASIDYQKSFDFLREFDNNYRRALVTNRSQQIYLSRSWSHYNFSIRGSVFETFFTQFDNSIRTTYLPQVSLSSFRTKLADKLPVYFSFSSSFNRWQYGWRTEFDQGLQRKSQSLGFSPTLSIPFSAIPWLTFNANLTGNLTHYAQSFAPNTRRVIDEPVLNANYVVSAEAVGPVIYKIYQAGWLGGSDPRLKHVIEPFFRYQYDSPVANANRIITAYGFFRYHQLSYGVTNRLIIKQDEMPREVFTWGLSQVLYFAPEESPLSIFKLKDGSVPRFSEISSYMRFYPGRKYSLDFSAGYNTYYKTLSSVRLAANLNSPLDPFYLNLSWFKSMNPWYQDVFFDRHQIGLSGGAKIPWLSLDALAEIDFNIAERKMLYSGVSLVYHYQCLDFKADVRVFQFREKPETQFKLSIGLGNIGKTTDFLGGMEIR